MMRPTLLLILVLMLNSLNGTAQNTRLSDHNTIGWYTTTGTIGLNKKLSLHAEYQWRRDRLGLSWQQSLLRTGLNIKVNDQLTLRAGYAWILTFPYGDYTLQAAGKTFPEHRLYEMAQLNQRNGTMDVLHRFMLEQRWIGRMLSSGSTKPDEWSYVNRFRYMLRLQHSLRGPSLEDKEPYAAAYDEFFLGFGKNVNENVFDQNRLGLLLGYRFHKNFRLEGGYFNQIVQLPREINGRNVFQYNSGIIINTFWAL